MTEASARVVFGSCGNEPRAARGAPMLRWGARRPRRARAATSAPTHPDRRARS